MKKILFLLCCLWVTMARAADYPVIYTQAPENDPDTIAENKHPQKYGVVLMGGYGVKNHSGAYARDIVDTELELARYLSPRHALTCSLSFAFAYYNNDGNSPMGKYYTDGYDRDLTALMLGYRFTQRLGRYYTISLGAKAGPEINSLNVDYGRDIREGRNFHLPPCAWEYGNTHSRLGLAYAAYATIGLPLSHKEQVSLNIGYQFRGTTSAPKAERGFGADAYTIRTNPMQWHEVRVGFTVRY